MKPFRHLLALFGFATYIGHSAGRAESSVDQARGGVASDRLAFVQRATQLTSGSVRDRQDHEIGRIDDFVLNLASAQVLGALVAPPHVYGDYHVFIPAGSFASASGDGAVLNCDRTNLTAEPCVTRDVFDSPDFSKKIAEAFTRFGATPVWKDSDGPQGFIKFSKLPGMKIRNRQENLGQATDLMIDLPAARIVFLIASLDITNHSKHSFYAVPPTAVNMEQQNSTLVLTADRTSLAKAALSGEFIWAQMNNPNWAAATYRVYGQEPSFTAHPPLKAPTAAPTTSSENLFSKIGDDSTTVRIVKPTSRSDAELTQAVISAIVQAHLDTPFTDNQVQVTTAQGRVTLRGHATNATQKVRLHGIAESIAGRDNVEDQVQVSQ